MDFSRIFRKRYYPQECVLLKDDLILYESSEVLVTSWRCLRPRKDRAGGISAYFSADGFKVSKFIDHSGQLIHWYCDIICCVPHPEGGTIFEDLLVDVVVEKDGSVYVLDLDEAAQMLSLGVVTPAQLSDCLAKTDRLLRIIYSGKFHRITEWIEKIEAGCSPAPGVTLTQLLSD